MKLELINRNVYTLSGAYVEITSRCNLRCKHCYNESGELKTEFTLDQIKNIIEDIPHKESAAFTISGGEPLLHPHFWDILDLVLHNNFARVLVITNGTLIDESAAKKFAERNCSIQVSINGQLNMINCVVQAILIEQCQELISFSKLARKILLCVVLLHNTIKIIW